MHRATTQRAASSHPSPFARGRTEHPKVIEQAGAVGIVAEAPEEPEIAAAVGPAYSATAASGNVSGGRHTQRAIHTGLSTKRRLAVISSSIRPATAHRAASAHPCPFVRGRIELPKVVERGGCNKVAHAQATPKEPEIAFAVGPGRSTLAAWGDVSGGRHTQDAIHSRLLAHAASTHPGPFICGRIELPKLVEIVPGDLTHATHAGATAPKEPEIAVLVGPAHRVNADSGEVSGSKRSQCTVHSKRATRAASAHPCPFVRGRVKNPEVVAIATLAIAIIALAPEQPELAALISPARSALAGSGDISGSRCS